MSKKSDITHLLSQLHTGDKKIYDRLYTLVYDELKKLAYSHMYRQTDHTLSKTELVHETYLNMVGQQDVNFTDRSHFLAISSKCMR